MTKERELLKRALESFDWMDVDNLVTDDIRTYLNQSEIPTGCAAEPDPEPVYLKKIEDGVWYETSKSGFNNDGILPGSERKILYTRPSPAKKPMTHEEIVAAFESENPDTYFADFRDSIRYAEKHHGILGGDNE